MTVRLDPPRFAGDVAAAALVEQTVSSACRWGGVTANGSKRPVAVLVRQAGSTSAFEVDGTRIEASDFERCHPGQWAAFEGLAAAGGED